jgi:hypothetical protein
MTRACSIGAVLALPTIGIIIASPLRCGQQERGAAAPVDAVTLPAGLGAVGDAHAGATVHTADGWPQTRPGLRIGATAVVEVTGWRNPCTQIDAFRPGLLRPVVRRAADGSLVRRAGIMGVVAAGGDVAPGDVIAVELPEGPHEPLGRV